MQDFGIATLKVISLFLFLLLVFTGSSAGAAKTSSGYQWPVQTDKKLQISSTFGESRIDHYHNGVDIPGKNIKIRPVKPGRLLWKTNARITPGRLPFGGGKTVLMEHGDTWSGYMHLSSLSRPVTDLSMQNTQPTGTLNTKFNETLGASGNTGHSGGAHLHFFIYQPEKKIMYNPLLVLDDTLHQDTTKPEFFEMAALIDQRDVIFNPEKELLLSRDYPLLLRILDRGKGQERWGIYRLSVTRNGKDIINRKFDRLQFTNGRWRDMNGATFEEVFFGRYMILGTGFQSSPDFAVTAAGLNGPQHAENFSLKVKTR